MAWTLPLPVIRAVAGEPERRMTQSAARRTATEYRILCVRVVEGQDSKATKYEVVDQRRGKLQSNGVKVRCEGQEERGERGKRGGGDKVKEWEGDWSSIQEHGRHAAAGTVVKAASRPVNAQLRPAPKSPLLAPSGDLWCNRDRNSDL